MNNSQRLSLSGTRISRPERDLVEQFSVSFLGGLSAGAGPCGLTPEDSLGLVVVVLPCGVLLDELSVELVVELLGLRWILFLRNWAPVSVSTI